MLPISTKIIKSKLKKSMKEEKVVINTQLTRRAGNKGGKSTARHWARHKTTHANLQICRTVNCCPCRESSRLRQDKYKHLAI